MCTASELSQGSFPANAVHDFFNQKLSFRFVYRYYSTNEFQNWSPIQAGTMSLLSSLNAATASKRSSKNVELLCVEDHTASGAAWAHGHYFLLLCDPFLRRGLRKPVHYRAPRYPTHVRLSHHGHRNVFQLSLTKRNGDRTRGMI